MAMKKTTKARKYNSPKLQALMDEITPTEMEQTKIKMQLAARIEDMMNQKGWGKSQFAEKVGKNPSEITKWFSGTQNFTIDILTEIAMVFAVDITVLFGKRDVKVISRQVVVVNSIGFQPSNPYATPITGREDEWSTIFSGFSHGNQYPITPLC